MNIKQAKEIDIVDYLASQGIHPDKPPRGNDYWYKSPFRDERTPSFKVNRALNKWYDWGDGIGGNLLDLGVLMHNCSIEDFLGKLDGSGASLQLQRKLVGRPSLKEDESNHIQILNTHIISSYPLVKYLQNRRISADIANKFCQEARYKIGDKTYYAIGFKNDAGGYELRNQHFKGSSSPKDVTFFDNDAKEVAVFEGFFNFLSHRTIFQNQDEPKQNFLILNSTSFFEKSLPKMQEHNRVHLFLDNDKTGEKFSQLAIKIDHLKFKDERSLYHKYEDLNDWLMHIGLSPKQRLSQKL